MSESGDMDAVKQQLFPLIAGQQVAPALADVIKWL